MNHGEHHEISLQPLSLALVAQNGLIESIGSLAHVHGLETGVQALELERKRLAISYAVPLGEGIAEAQDTYQKVMLDPTSQITVDQQLVQWKSLDLPEVTPEAAEPAPVSEVEAEESDSEEGE